MILQQQSVTPTPVTGYEIATGTVFPVLSQETNPEEQTVGNDIFYEDFPIFVAESNRTSGTDYETEHSQNFGRKNHSAIGMFSYMTVMSYFAGSSYLLLLHLPRHTSILYSFQCNW